MDDTTDLVYKKKKKKYSTVIKDFRKAIRQSGAGVSNQGRQLQHNVQNSRLCISLLSALMVWYIDDERVVVHKVPSSV